MHMSKSVLLTRPEHDVVTKYLCAWSEEVVSLARSKGMKVCDLRGRKAKKSEFDSYMRANQPALFFMNGHGSASVITGHDNEVLVDSRTQLKDGIIYARSCDAGHVLGHQLINNGAKVFIGYRRKFICGYMPERATRPLQDPIACLFLAPSNLVVSTLIKGNTADEAHIRSRKEMYKNFRRMISSAGSSEEKYAARWLWNNISNQVLLGNAQGKVQVGGL